MYIIQLKEGWLMYGYAHICNCYACSLQCMLGPRAFTSGHVD